MVIFSFILLINLFALSSRLTYWLTVLFNNLTAFSEETLSSARLKARKLRKYLGKVSLINYIRYKNIQIEFGELFYKKVACLHVLKITCYSYFTKLWLGAHYTLEM